MTTKASSGNFSSEIYNYVTAVRTGGPIIANIAITNSSYVVTGSNILSTVNGGHVKIIGSNFFSNTQVLVKSGSIKNATIINYTSNSELQVQLPASNAGVNLLYVVNYDGKFAANTIGYV